MAEVERNRAVPHGDPRGALAQVQVLARDAGQGAVEEGDRRDPQRDRGRAQADVREPEWPEALVRVRMGRRSPMARPSVSGDDLRLHPRRHRAVHERAAMPDLQGQAPQARSARRDDRRPEHRRGDRAHRERGARLGDLARARARRARRARAQDRPSGPQGDPYASRLSRRRGARLPDSRPIGDDTFRWRSAADPARYTDRFRPDGGALHPRRTLDRPAPAGQRPAHPHPARDARSGEHHPCRRAR